MSRDKPRFVFDANVLVSAALFARSLPRQALDHAQNIGVLLIAETTFAELQNVLQRPKFDRYAARGQREQFWQNFLLTTQLVAITETIVECRDPKDNQYLELAISGHATAIVSGDQDLLVLHPFRGLPIVNVQTFLATAWV
jgi:uncharacterized protein